MSAGDGGPGRREVAYRLFAAEYDDADFSYSESDEERAPNYVVTPTGARVNRLFAVGVLTETEPVNEEMLRARVVDPTGAFVVYAGQYQPDALAFLERAETPSFLAVTGKARTFQPEDSDLIYTSVRPESISEVDGDTRDRWVVQAAERTLERVETMAAAVDSGLSGDALRDALAADGVDPSLAAGIPLALDHYGTTPEYLAAVRQVATDALETVAGERDEVRPLDVSPGEGGGDAAALTGRELAVPADAGAAGTDSSATASRSTAGAESESASEPASESAPDSDSGEPAGTEPPMELDTDAEPEPSEEGIESTATPDASADESTADATSADAESTDPGAPDDDLADTDEVGDFDPDGEFDPDEEGLSDEEFDPDEEVLSDEEREEAEELGGFSTGNEVEDPDDADLGTPATADGNDAEGTAEAPTSEPAADGDAADDVSAAADADAAGSGADAVETTDDRTDEAETEDVPVEDALMDAMAALDEGDGAPRDALVDAVADRTGASEADVDAAIEDALMSGRCYEPDDDVFKPI